MAKDVHLARALMGYEPIVDRRRNAIAMRLTIDADTVARGGGAPNMAALYRELSVHWAGSDSAIALKSTCAIDDELLALEPLKTIWIEVPAAFAETAAGQEILPRLRKRGFTMILAGQPRAPLAPALAPAFGLSIIHVDEDRRLKAEPGLSVDARRSIPYVQEGVRSIATMDACFATGAHAVIGWPMEDALRQSGAANSSADYLTIIELISMLDRGEDPAALESIIRRDAALAYKLLRFINSPGFGLSVEVQSFRHAVMMLGYARLKRWLALLLATASKEANLRPLMVASFRRGVFLENLIGAGPDDPLRDEVFILGVFSLLDKLMRQPFAELFKKLHVPARVCETLLEGRGPYAPYLRVVELLERGPDSRLQESLDACVMSLEHCNRAVLRALTTQDLIAA